jgi:hypothetical protein
LRISASSPAIFSASTAILASNRRARSPLPQAACHHHHRHRQSQQGARPAPARWGNNALIGKMSAQAIDRLRALVNEKVRVRQASDAAGGRLHHRVPQSGQATLWREHLIVGAHSDCAVLKRPSRRRDIGSRHAQPVRGSGARSRPIAVHIAEARRGHSVRARISLHRQIL